MRCWPPIGESPVRGLTCLPRGGATIPAAHLRAPLTDTPDLPIAALTRRLKWKG
jgi:hypothetical protein